jgi:hypothetical protein
MGRLKYSLLSNAQYNAIVLISGIVGLVYVSISYGVTPESLMGVLMALAYCWGLVLAIYLMGHGLVAIPRSLFRNASISGRLRRIQAKAPRVHEKMEDAIQKLEDLEAQIAELSKRKTGSARHFQDWIEELADAASLPEAMPVTLGRRMSSPILNIPAVITERYLADISRQFYRARHSRIRFVEEWGRLVREASVMQSILDSAVSKRLEIGRFSQFSFLERHFTPYTRHLYYAHIIPYARILFGGLLSLASVCIIWSELIKAAAPSLSIINLTVVHHPDSDKGQIGFPGQVIASAWIMYMCSAALSSMTEVRVWRGRALVRRNTAHESALWYAMQVAKLSIPLAYNLLTFLSPDVYKNTIFFHFLGKFINLTPLGKWFDYLFPTFILVPVCATLFNLYGRVKRWMGFNIVEDDDQDENTSGYGMGGWREGRDLIERELNGGSALAYLRDGSTDGRPKTRTTLTRGPTSRQTTGNSAPSIPANAAVLSTLQNTEQRLAPEPVSSSEPDPESDGFFTMLGHRVKNTLDTVQTPKWMKESIKRPNWMGAIDHASSSSTSPGRSGNNIMKLFGGSRSEGQIRL